MFCRNYQIQYFLATVDAIFKRLNYFSHIFASNCDSSISTRWNSVNSLQKAQDLTTSTKNKRKIFKSKN